MKAWEKNIRSVTPYVPGEQPKIENVIKLNTNENPYPPSPRVTAVMPDMEKLRLYPDPEAKQLVHAIADYHGLEDSQVFVGVGSDDVLAMSFLTFFNSGRPILFPDITYSFYDVWAGLFRIPYRTCSLNDRFQMTPDMYDIENGGIIFPNPNAPTGQLVDLDFIRGVLRKNADVVVIVDEAYIDFGGQSALPLLDEFDNLLIVRTFSKSRCLAGLRIGYAMGSPELIRALNDVKYSFNSYTLSQISIALGTICMEDEAYFRETVSKVIATRTWFEGELRRLGFYFEPSGANFVFATHPSASAKEIFEAAKAQGIYVRYFDQPRIRDYLRITIGTDEQMRTFVAFLESYLAKI